MTTEHPILFNSAMIRAILDGTKSQTRRIVKPQPEYGVDGKIVPLESFTGDKRMRHQVALAKQCPYGQHGSKLWARETWAHLGGFLPEIAYRADGQDMTTDEAFKRWRPSIHMPRWASRITLEITDIRVERVQDISERDAIAEGCNTSDVGPYAILPTARGRFQYLWDTINGKTYPWRSNPWVFVVSFRRIHP